MVRLTIGHFGLQAFIVIKIAKVFHSFLHKSQIKFNVSIFYLILDCSKCFLYSNIGFPESTYQERKSFKSTLFFLLILYLRLGKFLRRS